MLWYDVLGVRDNYICCKGGCMNMGEHVVCDYVAGI